MANDLGYNIKLNITVTRDSWYKDFKPLIEQIKPKRVKAFRVLTLKDANDDVEDIWSINDKQFATFVFNHQGVEGMVFEDNGDIIDSYLMFDPQGNVMVNTNGARGFVPFSELKSDGLESVMDVSKYCDRGAFYEW